MQAQTPAGRTDVMTITLKPGEGTEVELSLTRSTP